MSGGGIDWAALGEETVDLLRRYRAIDTTNPPGNETAGARFLAEVLAAHDIPSELAEAAPGRGNLVARLPGDGSLPASKMVDLMADGRRGPRTADMTLTSAPSPPARRRMTSSGP